MDRRRLLVAASIGTLLATVSRGPRAEEPETLDGLVTAYLAGRGAEVQIAPDWQLARRYALDLVGVVPSLEDLEAVKGKAPAEMYDYFAAKGPMPHTAGERPYLWTNLLRDADHFLFSNSSQFSQVAHVVELREQLRRVYDEGFSYREFARWALQSQMFLNRFPSAADRANAAFFLFLGRDSLACEVPAGNMWNAWVLSDPDVPASEAETNPDYHVHVYDPDRCKNGEAVCQATLWGKTGSTPKEVVDLMVGSPIFAEAVVDTYWKRVMGSPLPGVDFPEIRRVLVQGLVAHDFDIRWLLREIMTSAAYTQEMMFR